MLRGLVDQVLEGVTHLVLRGFFRSVESVGLDRVPRRRPVVVVANHFYGFVDPVLLVSALGRVPRFLAKASLWRRPLARPFLSLAGLVPIGSPSRDETTARNAAAFSFSVRVLRGKGMVALFPEGITHDVPQLAPLRTGAARLALHAAAAGARGVIILPVGLMYDDKLALRSRALVRVGEPVDLDAELRDGLRSAAAYGDGDHAAVRRLTTLIEQRLRAVVPDYPDFRLAAVLSRAAEIALRARRGDDGVVPLAERDALAQRLVRAPAAMTDRLIDALARYVLDLDLLGLRDHHLARAVGQRELLGAALTTGVQVVALAPLAIVGLVGNLLPFWCTRGAGRVAAAPVSKGTARLLVALVTFPAMWLGLGVVAVNVTGRGWPVGVAAVALLALGGLATVHCLERIVRVRRAWRGRIALRDRRTLLADVRADRQRVVAMVAEAEVSASLTGEAARET